MSAFPPEADPSSGPSDVGFGPIPEVLLLDHLIGVREQSWCTSFGHYSRCRRLFGYFELRLRLPSLAAAALTDNLSKNRQRDLLRRDGTKIETCWCLDPVERFGRHTVS